MSYKDFLQKHTTPFKELEKTRQSLIKQEKKSRKGKESGILVGLVATGLLIFTLFALVIIFTPEQRKDLNLTSKKYSMTITPFILVVGGIVTVVLGIGIWQARRINAKTRDLEQEASTEHIENPSVRLNQEYQEDYRKTLLPLLLKEQAHPITWQENASLSTQELLAKGLGLIFGKELSQVELYSQFTHHFSVRQQEEQELKLRFLSSLFKNSILLNCISFDYVYAQQITGTSILVAKRLDINTAIQAVKHKDRENFDLSDLDPKLKAAFGKTLQRFDAFTNKLSHAYEVLSNHLFKTIELFTETEQNNMIICMHDRYIFLMVLSGKAAPDTITLNQATIAESDYNRLIRYFDLSYDVAKSLDRASS